MIYVIALLWHVRKAFAENLIDGRKDFDVFYLRVIVVVPRTMSGKIARSIVIKAVFIVREPSGFER